MRIGIEQITKPRPRAFVISIQKLPAGRDIIADSMSDKPTSELSVLYEKLRALHTLMRYESDLEKLKFYNRELGTVTADLHEAEVALQKKKANAKVLRFVPKKPVRSA
jgi:hypothetical protein